MTDLVLELEISYLPLCGDFSVGTFVVYTIVVDMQVKKLHKS